MTATVAVAGGGYGGIAVAKALDEEGYRKLNSKK